ncbi:hypothetical protein RP726_05540 [Candidatus Methylospira mobilis]|uniref:hypothetical protein n=1 Tax=Candidatus Methylospira mobilis TaxID=1808979 RepID=UPI0028F07271|nr:hypothetical protein [Candidatus Methylospira mobilis]WNV05875.1 hypothetical protein RP726_05540 [Candidatus Methylospira mobilis]
MSGRTWTAQIKGKDITVTSEKLAEWQSFYISDPDIVNRISELMWFDIYVLEAGFGVSPPDILNSINDLETGETSIGVKPATQFSRQPLKGLWHKHFFSAHFVVNNIRLGHGRNGLENLIKEVFDKTDSPIVTHEMIRFNAQPTPRMTNLSCEYHDSNYTTEIPFHPSRTADRHFFRMCYPCC